MKNLFLSIIFITATTILLSSCTEQFSEKGILPNQSNPNDLMLQPVNANNATKTEVPNDAYIIVYKDQTTDKELEDEVGEMDKSEGVKADRVYKNAIKGFAARLSPSVLNKLKNNPKVDFIEKDQVMSANALTVSTPSWGIDRIDQANLPLSNSFTYTSSGTGVDAYIIDTGILTSHTDFGGRAVGGYSSVVGTSSSDWIDANGHGTHVAGTVGGLNYGVAKNVNLIAVRVLDGNGSGTTSGVIDGINWAIAHHKTRSGTAVGNMSLGGGASTALDLAVSNAVAAKIVMCVAAGNNSANAANYSPARVSVAITVGATGAGSSYDAFATYSNYGSIVDILAPGTSIKSDYIGTTLSTAILSGTSMATPHVTGVVAQYLSKNPSALPSAVDTYLKSTSNKNKISGLRSGTVNSLLFSSN
jgi:subtilisin family serine protease